MYILIISLVFTAALCKAIRDVLQHHFRTSVFKRWSDLNPKGSWQNKWEFNEDGDITGERFPGSSTVFVMFTDLYHFLEFVKLTSWMLLFIVGIVFSQEIRGLLSYSYGVNMTIIFITIKVFHNLSFESWYRALK